MFTLFLVTKNTNLTFKQGQISILHFFLGNVFTRFENFRFPIGLCHSLDWKWLC